MQLGARVPDLEAWLQELGLSRFVKAFEENEIDSEVLPYLTDNMLAQIGLPVGPRVKLLAAISKLPSSTAPAVAEAQREEDQPTVLRREAERRQITVMFCDLVDSTNLAERLDPEDFAAVMEDYQKACGTIIERCDGHIAQYRGDGIEAYFGWPSSREDAAECAVRAGLEVVEAVRTVPGPHPLSVRVGIGTGVVVIGETGFGDPSVPSGAVGKTLHVAARLQSIGVPNSVVIAETTSRLVSGRFDQEDLGPQTLKGVTGPVRAFRVRRALDDSRRFQAAHAGTLTPLVGRHAEVAFLQQRWCDAREGGGRAVFISGIPGIGKSRVVHEFEARIRCEPHFSLTFQCLPHCMQTAFFPVIQQIQRLSGLKSEELDDIKLDKIERLLSLATNQAENAAPFIAEMISIPIASRYESLSLTAQQIKARTLFVLFELLRSLSTRRPIFCLLEDVHWIDPSTQELLDVVVSQIEQARILLVATYRPEYQPQPQKNVTQLTIARLKRSDAAEMARLALRDRTVSDEAMHRIVDESDSIPLFVEELAHGTIEADGLDHQIASNQHREAPSWSVPESLRDSLTARLDRAPSARNVAQMAAVIGREFSYDVLRSLTSLNDAELHTALLHLGENEIIQLIDNKPVARYAFKHALVRDVAYETLLKSRRRQIHAKMATIIENAYPEIVTGQPELLAYHYGLAGNSEAAARCWLLGGHRARSRSANLEASVQYKKALEFLQSQPDTPERRATELEIQLSLGGCFIAVRGYSSEDTRKAFERACSLSAEIDEPYKGLQAIFGLWGHFWMRANHDRAIALGEMLLAKADHLHDLTALVVAWRALGSTLFTLGDFVRARDHFVRALESGQRPATAGSTSTYAVDPRIASQLMLAWDLWILGYPEQALRNVLQALAQATQRDEAYTAAFAHYVTSAVQLLRGEFHDSLANANKSLALSREHRINLYALYSRFGRGCALANLGQMEKAIFEIREGIEEARQSNLGYMRGFMLGWLATVQAKAGDAEVALSTLREALEQTNDIAGRAWEAELLRLRGDILLVVRPDAASEAELSYDKAILVARRQSARSLELRATTSLARLLRAQGRSKDARARLIPMFGWFTEGFDTADLKEARSLCNDLTKLAAQ